MFRLIEDEKKQIQNNILSRFAMNIWMFFFFGFLIELIGFWETYILRHRVSIVITRVRIHRRVEHED